MPEARLLGKLRHKNLVKLLGFCITKDEKLLAYELMPNGSLEDYMFDAVKRRPLLDWTTRYNIIKGIASGLLYLHESSPSTTIIHRDLKLDNILLDEKMIPKIADFGLAKLFVDTQVSAKTYQITGTFGYMSPEYMNGGKYSNKSDVFAFGIMLLEIVSGQSNLKYYQTSGMGDLPSYAWRLWKEDQPSMFIDTALFDKNPSNDMVRCVQIGLLCTEPSPKKRPDMSSVIFMLSGSQKLPLPSSKPTFSFPPGFPRGKNHVASTSRVEDEANQSRFLKSISQMAQTSHPIPR